MRKLSIVKNDVYPFFRNVIDACLKTSAKVVINLIQKFKLDSSLFLSSTTESLLYEIIHLRGYKVCKDISESENLKDEIGNSSKVLEIYKSFTRVSNEKFLDSGIVAGTEF